MSSFRNNKRLVILIFSKDKYLQMREIAKTQFVYNLLLNLSLQVLKLRWRNKEVLKKNYS